MKALIENWQRFFFIASIVISALMIGQVYLNERGDCDNPEKNKSFKHCDFKGVNFSGRDFMDVDFGGKDLTGANFENAVLLNVSFHRSVLNKVSFKNSYVYFTNFMDSCLLDADFSGVKFHKLNYWDGANLTKVNLSNTRLADQLETIQSESYRINCEQNSGA